MKLTSQLASNCLKGLQVSALSRGYPATISRFYSQSPSSEQKYFILKYDYNPDNLVERRAPHRPLHLSLCKEFSDKGKLLFGGAYVNPINGATVVFKGSEADVQDFIKRDPYVQNGIVTGHSYREWNVVVGSLCQS